MSLNNAEKVDSYTFEFDVTIKSTGSNFTLTSYQCSFSFNQLIINGGNISFNYVGSTSQLNNPPSLAIGYDSISGAPRLHFASNAGNDNITSTEKKVGRFRVQNSNIFGNYCPDLTWNFDGLSNTILTGSGFTNITVPNNHLDLNYNNPLPVEFNFFNVALVESKINLTWQTGTEMNNKGFEVQRSIGSDKSEWELRGFIAGEGNSSQPKTYNFTDNLPVNTNKVIYRLKQIDLDGSVNFSQEVEIDLTPVNYTLYQNYPNPLNPSTKIRFSVPKESMVILGVYNIIGELVTELLNDIKTVGNYEITWGDENLSSGSYILYFKAKSREDNEIYSSVKKMILLQ